MTLAKSVVSAVPDSCRPISDTALTRVCRSPLEKPRKNEGRRRRSRSQSAAWLSDSEATENLPGDSRTIRPPEIALEFV